MSARSRTIMMTAIDKKLDALGAAFDAHSKRDQEQLDNIARWTAKIDARFDGEEGRVGLTVRIDRLEQERDRRTRVFWWLMGVTGTLLTTAIGGLVYVLTHARFA